MRIVPVRIDDEDLKRIDVLVKQEAYLSRDEAVRRMIKSKLAEALVEVRDEDVSDLVERLLRMKLSGKEPVVLRFKKSAVGIVAEGRD